MQLEICLSEAFKVQIMFCWWLKKATSFIPLNLFSQLPFGSERSSAR